MRRRTFFQGLAAASAAGFCPSSTAGEARTLVRGGAIGQVIYARASSGAWLQLASEICGRNTFVMELEPAAAPGAVLLGSRATLSLSAKGCRLLS